MKSIQFLSLLVLFILLSACKNDKGVSEQNSVNYEEVGLEIAIATKTQLGKNLIGTLEKKGAIEALQFCNIKAYPLTDSMATAHNARIKRVSDKPRNPNNQANQNELEKIEYFKSILEKDEEINPIIEPKGDTINFYYPILTNDMCLKCHGTSGQEIELSIIENLQDLYPNDKAIGYSTNQIRGIWSIQIKKQ